MSDDLRFQKAQDIAKEAGTFALNFFNNLSDLNVEDKGPQDFVTEADKAVELLIREAITKYFPEDGIVGEEHSIKASSSSYTWVIDPIDGTTNFINAIPAWTVVIAIVKDGVTQIGITHDPVHNETFSAMLGAGAFLNKTQIFCTPNTNLNRGTIGTGFSNRVSTKGIKKLINLIFEEGGMYHRNASCALSLAYVASGRLLGYIEEHLNAWDCLAGQLLISEAGGQIEKQDTNKMIQRGGRVVVGSSGVFDQLVKMANKAFKD